MKRKTTKAKLASLSASDWKFIEAIADMPPKQRLVFVRLMRLLSNANRSGDKFTWRRFCELSKQGVPAERALAELSHAVAAS